MTFYLKHLVTFTLIASSLVSNNIRASVENEPDIKRLIASLVTKHGFNEAELNDIFSKTMRVPDVIEKITKPAEAMPWHRYQQIFLKPERIEKGLTFWEQHKDTLDRAEKKYGVPSKVILGILGVETRFGDIAGNYRIIDALTTLALDYPKRSDFFGKELEQFLLLTREEKLDPLAIIGSYAGAIGLPQFMPSSYRHYAVDFNGDGIRDLVNSPQDAIGSVANYLSVHGWSSGTPVTSRLVSDNDKLKPLAKKGVKPHTTISDLKQFGISLDEHWENSPHKTAIIELETSDGFEYWLGLNNFYVITRYNQSPLYAMAVYQLAGAIDTERTKLTRAE